MNGLEQLKNTLSNIEICSSEYSPEYRTNYHYADWKYEKLKEQILDFQESLSDEVDVAVQLASFGTNIVMEVTEIGYQNPDLMYFWGCVNGCEAQLIQHISNLNFLLLAVKKDDPTKAPRRIGFAADEKEE